MTERERAYKRLPWLIATMTAVALVTGAIALYSIEERLVANTGESLAMAATDIADKLDSFLAGLHGDAEVLARSPLFHGTDHAAMSRHLQTLQDTKPAYVWLAMTDATGRIVVATDPATVGRDRSTAHWFQAARAGKTVVVGDVEPMEETVEGMDVIAFTVPILTPTGEFRGTVTTRACLTMMEDAVTRSLRAFQERRGLATTLEYQFLTGDGRVFADSDLAHKGLVNLKGLGLPSARLSDAPRPGFVEEEHRRRHVPVITGYARSQGFGETVGLSWRVLVRMDRRDVLAPIRLMLVRLGLGGALLFVPMLLALLWTTTRLRLEWSESTRQVERLDGLKRVSQTLQHVGGPHDPDAVLEKFFRLIVETATELTGARYGALGQFDKEGTRLVRFVTTGLDEAARSRIGQEPTGRGLLGFMGNEPSVLRLTDLTRHPASSGFPPGHPPMHSFLGASIQVQGRVFGRIYLTEKQGADEFSELDEQVLAALAAEAGVAVEKERYLEQLQASERLYRTTMASLPVAVARLDQQDALLLANQAFYPLIERSEQEAAGRLIGTLLPMEGLAAWLRAIRTSRQEGPHEVECLIPPGDGKSCRVSASLLSKTQEIVLVIEDLSALKESEAHLRASEEQLRQAQKMEAVGQLAGGIAHDFNNLLTVINGHSELLLLTLPLDSPGLGSMQEIKRAGERAAAMTNQLLAFSRRQVIDPRTLNLNTVVEEMETLLRRLIGEHIELEFRQAADLWAANADVGQLEQVILNLAVNARDAMPAGGRLIIESKNVRVHDAQSLGGDTLRPGAYVALTVTDTGTGMDVATRSRVFEPFFTTKPVGKGTGLGLSTVYGIVKQSGGAISVDSAPGEGTTFTIYLPRVEAEPGTQTAHVQTPTMPGGSETILLAEDEEAVRSFVRTILEAHGYTVLEAARGEEALRVSRDHAGPIHLLLTDVVMPGLSGREVKEALGLSRPEIRTLYMSGYTDDAVIRHGILTQENALLQKPFAPRDLATKVREVLDS